MSEPAIAPQVRRQGTLAAAGLTGAAAIAALALGLIRPFEGIRYTGYLDPVGIPTSCTGHTGPDAVVGRRYTHEQCEAQLERDLQRTASAIEPCITRPVPNEVRAAMVSFAFNVGGAAYCGSSVARKLNAGDTRGACDGLLAWRFARGRELPGLVRRRAAERALCLQGVR